MCVCEYMKYGRVQTWLDNEFSNMTDYRVRVGSIEKKALLMNE